MFIFSKLYGIENDIEKETSINREEMKIYARKYL